MLYLSQAFLDRGDPHRRHKAIRRGQEVIQFMKGKMDPKSSIRVGKTELENGGLVAGERERSRGEKGKKEDNRKRCTGYVLGSELETERNMRREKREARENSPLNMQPYPGLGGIKFKISWMGS